MTEANRRLIRRILRVNHAGEHGAISIYDAQIAGVDRGASYRGWLEETLGHERRHRERFQAAMPERAAKPCRALFVWSFGGATLGAITAWFGRTGVMACTAAVERTVHRHLVEQIAFLERADPELCALVRDILVEEDEHLAFAEANHQPNIPLASMLRAVIAASTELLIFVSTRGDSLGLRRALRAAQVT